MIRTTYYLRKMVIITFIISIKIGIDIHPTNIEFHLYSFYIDYILKNNKIVSNENTGY
jgi:hypothetical protein